MSAGVASREAGFSRFRLLLRSLRHYWRANLALLISVAVATAILTGALMVDDSVRGSLRTVVENRLGPVDQVLTSAGFFRGQLAEGVQRDAEASRFYAQCVPGIILTGGASSAESPLQARNVQIGALADWVSVPPGQCVINRTLAEALGVSPGQEIILRTSKGSLSADILATRDREHQISALRLRVSRIEERGFSAEFVLNASQRATPIAWVNLGELQQALAQPNTANVLLLCARNAGKLPEMLPSRLFQLEDYGLKLRPVSGGQVALERPQDELPAEVVSAALSELKGRTPADTFELVTILLASSVQRTAEPGQTPPGSPATLHYVVIAGLDGEPYNHLGPQEAILNAWTAEQLSARPGDSLDIRYYARANDGTVIADMPAPPLRVKSVMPMQGDAADPTLAPDFPGITDVARIADWKPPAELHVDLGKVTKADEQYWQQYRAAPKILMSAAGIRELLDSGTSPQALLNHNTSLRLPAERAEELSRNLPTRLSPGQLGYTLRNIRADQLASAEGNTDFGQLLLGLSGFLIFAAALLMALVLRLNVEQRLRQLGLLSAIGYTDRSIRRILLAETMAVAGAGVLAGLPVAAGYCGAIMAGLRSWWLPAIGTTALQLHVTLKSLALGFLCSLLVALLTALWALRIVRKLPAVELLSGRANLPLARPRRAWLWRLAFCTLTPLALLITAWSIRTGSESNCLVGGAIFLLGGLASLPALLSPRARKATGSKLDLLKLALRNATRRRTRSVLTAALVAMAVFIIVILAAFRQERPKGSASLTGDDGGFSLILSADIPLPQSPGSIEGRRMLGLRPADDALWKKTTLASMSRYAGQDASCLNIMRPTAPTLLAVPAGAFSGRFSFARTLSASADPWTLLEASDEAGTIPVIADDDTARYILHLDLGRCLTVTDGLGRPAPLRLVGTLKGSIFQNSLLMGEQNFRQLFPAENGFGQVLVQATPPDLPELRWRLGEGLSDYAVSVEPSADLLARYQEVANTYLSTFQVLGALGLALGTVGLTVVLLRNLLERRSEMALLAAVGYPPRRRVAIVLLENALLLLLGVLTGLTAALIAIAPAIADRGRFNAEQTAAILGLTLAVGLVLPAIAAWRKGRGFSPSDLRAE